MGLIRALRSDMVQDTVQVGKGPAIHVPGNGLLKRSLPQRGSLMERVNFAAH